MKHEGLRDMFKKASMSVCTKTVFISHPLPPTLPIFAARKTPDNTDKDPDYPAPADGDTHMTYFPDLSYSPRNEKLPVIT